MTSSNNLRVNEQRLAERLEDLAVIGRGDQGGLIRVAYTDADLKGREYAIRQMGEAALEVSVDAAGNILGRRAGSGAALPPILFGSHIDSVPEGGNYDGSLGSLASIECAHALEDAGLVTRHPLEIVIFANEEGGLTGSRAMVGEFLSSELDQVSQSGFTHREGIKRLGGDPDNLPQARRKPGTVKAYLELHVEQGGILEESGITIGVVEGIVGIRCEEVTIEGEANHAGTTPMARRKDALLVASKVIQSVNETATSTPGTQVATVGRIEVLPGAPNIIPGQVVMTIEVRDLSQQKIEALTERMITKAKSFAREAGVKIRVRQSSDNLAAPTDPVMRHLVEESARALGLSFRYMPSGAGHDAQNLARIAPVGMIFVPSVGGISHSPEEHTRHQDLTHGANVLLGTILRVDAGPKL